MIDFLKYRYVCMASSIALLVVGIAAYAIKGGFQYHIDFVGGTELRITFDKQLPISQLRSALSEKGWQDPVIQSVGINEQDFLVRVASMSGEGVEEKFTKDMSEAIPDNKLTIKTIDWVGAEVGKDITWNAFQAVFYSMLILLLYIAMRYRFKYAVGAVAALAHDVFMVLIIFLLLGEQISVNVLGALLAILGYSLNDTIVIYSRIRENVDKIKGMTEAEIVNLSINQTLSRTLLTSFATLLAVMSVFLLGGESLRGFSLAMLIGIVFGTYSSIYIASPIMLAVSGSSKENRA